MSENILKNINLEINYGEKVAIVGQNGSGKTTLMKTILGLYSNKSENIKINNIKFNDLDIKKYQEKKFPFYSKTLFIMNSQLMKIFHLKMLRIAIILASRMLSIRLA